jgi:hypothetical protein
MIEISSEEYWKEFTYDDAKLYVALLNIDGKNDWRMFKNDEEWKENKGRIADDGDDYGQWWQWVAEDDKKSWEDEIYLVIPVRDI